MTGFKFVVISTLLLVSVAQLCGAEKKKSCPAPQTAKDEKFHPGQVWQYKPRAGEENSFLTVLKVESVPKLGTIVHVRVDKIRLKNCAGGPEPETIEHMPFSREAIERSVTKLTKDFGDVPDFQFGYDQWRAACGGVYTITVAEIVQVNQATFNAMGECKK